jgi:Succinyl-CoA synthetase, alpha subunit
MFTSEVQFGHAGSCANTDRETAVAKNKALSEAGAHVPPSFDSLGDIIHEVYDSLVQSGVIVPEPEVPPPTVPMDYSWARVCSFKKLNSTIGKLLPKRRDLRTKGTHKHTEA